MVKIEKLYRRILWGSWGNSSLMCRDGYVGHNFPKTYGDAFGFRVSRRLND